MRASSLLAFRCYFELPSINKDFTHSLTHSLTHPLTHSLTDRKRLFRATKQLLAKKEELSFPNYQDKSKLADDMDGFFVPKINRIRSDIDAVACERRRISACHWFRRK